jgi:23S rRNA (cytosine1962-C5)-methyltransferase
LQRALEMRETLYDTPFYRLIHAEADGLPGVVVDRFGETVVFQPNAAWADARSDMIAEALDRVLGPTAIVMNGAGRARKAEGLSEEVVLLKGNVDAAIPVQMNGATYFADVIGGQKTGLFFDQRPNHAFAARLARQGARVLDVFSHVGGFSLACLAQGARTALAVDGSSPALELAQKGAQAMNRGDDFQTRQGDAFQVMEALAAERAEFDIVICDPPAFAPNKKALDAGLRAYERVARLAAPLVRKGGYLGLCSCSHAADLSRFRGASARGIGRAGRSAQLIHTGFAGPDHPQLPQLAETGYLKSVFFRLN